MTKWIDDDVKAFQLHAGADGFCSMRDQQKLYKAMMKTVERVAKKTGMSEQAVFDQLSAEAARRGPIRPTPAKDY